MTKPKNASVIIDNERSIKSLIEMGHMTTLLRE